MFVLQYPDGTFAGPVYAREEDLQNARTYTTIGAAKNSRRYYTILRGNTRIEPEPVEVHLVLGPAPSKAQEQEENLPTTVADEIEIAPPILLGR